MAFIDWEAYFIELGASDGFSALANVLELLGIIITGIASIFAYRAAKRARDAADAVKQKINDFVLATELATATAIMEEIIRHQRAKSWEISLDRYTHLRRSLIQTKSRSNSRSPANQSKIQEAIHQTSSIMTRIEKALQDKSTFMNIPKYNSILASQIDSLGEVTNTLSSLQDNNHDR